MLFKGNFNLFSFYGSKKRLASLYPKPIFNEIIEPFEKDVFLYDIDPRIVSVWKYLIKATFLDIMSLPLFGPGTKLEEFQQLSQEEKWFLGYMISAAPSAPKKTATEKTNWTNRSQKRIAETVSLINHWHVDQLDFKHIPNREATWYVDPPYQNEGKWYDHKLKSDDYLDLKKCVERWLGEVIVCENASATWLDFKPLTEHKGQKNNLKIEGMYHKINTFFE